MTSLNIVGGHSAGPWKVEPTTAKNVHGSACVAFVVNDTTNVADICASGNITDEEAMANARLIAAAPDLKAALQGLIQECLVHGCFEGVSFDHPMVKPAFDAAYAALGKAELG